AGAVAVAVSRIHESLASAIQRHEPLQRFAASIIAALLEEPDLQRFVHTVAVAGEVGLSQSFGPGVGEAYLARRSTRSFHRVRGLPFASRAKPTIRAKREPMG